MEFDPNDSWAEVELYRWQHGELPPQDDRCKQLDKSAGLMAMADAIEKAIRSGNVEGMPAPHNVCSVLRYVAKLLPAPPGQRLIRREFQPVNYRSSVGRNEPCPCGSGLKHKKCCIKS